MSWLNVEGLRFKPFVRLKTFALMETRFSM